VLVGGEDPGRLLAPAATGNVALTFGWFLVGLGVAVWRLRARPAGDAGGLTLAGLLALVVLAFATAASAAEYKHPAWQAAWDSAAALVAFAVVRQLATPADGWRLTAVLLAAAVSLAAVTIADSAGAIVNLPRLEPPVPDLTLQWKLAPKEAQELAPRALGQPGAHAAFARPDTFAGWLVLLLPAAVAAAWAADRRMRTEFAVLLAGLLAVALLLTGQVAALAVLALVGRRRQARARAAARAG
jgi:hypothetical protein